ncbi:hypothetical protein AKAW_04121 [Aspergillus niger]|uniref:Heterokaryon incompatibility domain-containing protein n=1 Tax=Aspergillus niger TaxID=5061 RepID=A0A124BWP7_ASPNG|nr:hypothetical protein AKAW_04121 [Aspergillus niger]
MKVSSSLCQRCRVLQFNDEEHGTVEEQRIGEPDVNFNKFDPDSGRQAIILDYHLYDNLPDLPVMSTSSASGCGMCFAMREKILQLERRADPKHKNVLIYKFCLCYKKRWILRLGSPEFFNPSSHLAVHFKFIGDRNDDRISYTVSFDLQAEISDPCRSWLRIPRAPVSHPLSDKGRALLRKLAKKSYKLSRDPHLPTRVIDVGYWLTRSKMRLVVNQASHKWAGRGKYLALSYCWGSEEDAADQLKTTKASLCEHMKEIKMESLPRTVSDAVLVCRAMRVRYLWVDALCIIQDSQDDWERESAKMAEIYENSYFTLCALRGSSCQSGFLTETHRHLIKVPFQSTLKPSISGFYYIYHVMGYHEEDYHKSLLEGYPQHPDSSKTLDLAYYKPSAFDCDLNESHWNTRGWTLQEALCSPRLLLFGTRMAHYIALQLRQSQDTTFDKVCLPWGQNFHRDSGCHRVPAYGWHLMVEGYSARHFSFSRDKLPAISSLARKISPQIGGQYLAGI